MVKKQHKADEEFKEMNEPTRQEVEDLRRHLAAYEQVRIRGKLQRKFDQYCKTLGIISFNSFGEVMVAQPRDYHRMNQINEKLEQLERTEQEAYLLTHPEEKEKVKAQFAQMNKEMSKKFGIQLNH